MKENFDDYGDPTVSTLDDEILGRFPVVPIGEMNFSKTVPVQVFRVVPLSEFKLPIVQGNSFLFLWSGKLCNSLVQYYNYYSILKTF